MAYAEALKPVAEAPQKGEDVLVHLYDLSETFAQINSVAIDIIGFGGALHVGIEVFGVEWSFGTGGVSCTPPKQSRHYAYRQTVSMGQTLLAMQEVNAAVLAMQREWRGSEYDLFTKNCGTFCNALCVRLGVGNLPAWVTRLAEAGGRSKTVRTIADMMVRNGMIGEASPMSQSQQSQMDFSPRLTDCSPYQLGGSCDGSSEGVQSPRREGSAPVFSLEDLSGDEWLEDDDKSPIPGNSEADTSAGLSRSDSSPVRGNSLPQRCATFRANSYAGKQALKSMSFEKGCKNTEKTFVAKRLALGPRPGYLSHDALLAVAAKGGG